MKDPEPMDRPRELLMAALDGEIADADRAELDRSLEADAALRAEWKRLSRLRDVTRRLSFARPPDEVWDGYWGSVYNRLERGAGWALLSAGAIVLAAWGAWTAAGELLLSASLPPVVKAAIALAALGGIILAVSVVREKLAANRADPYKGIPR